MPASRSPRPTASARTATPSAPPRWGNTKAASAPRARTVSARPRTSTSTTRPASSAKTTSSPAARASTTPTTPARAAAARATSSAETSSLARETRCFTSRSSSSVAACASARTSPASSSTPRLRSRTPTISAAISSISTSARPPWAPAAGPGLMGCSSARSKRSSLATSPAATSPTRCASASTGEAHVRHKTDADLHSSLGDIGLYADATLRATPWLALRGGARADLFAFDVLDACAVKGVSLPSLTDPPGDASCFSPAARRSLPRAHRALLDRQPQAHAPRLAPRRTVQVLHPLAQLRHRRPLHRSELHHPGRGDALRQHHLLRRRGELRAQLRERERGGALDPLCHPRRQGSGVQRDRGPETPSEAARPAPAGRAPGASPGISST